MFYSLVKSHKKGYYSNDSLAKALQAIYTTLINSLTKKPQVYKKPEARLNIIR
jgi:hypothetical protein